MCRLLVVAAAAWSAHALVPRVSQPQRLSVVRGSEEGGASAPAPAAESSVALVPVNEANIQTSASVSAGTAGLVLGGPVVAAIAAVLGNYSAKQDNEVGEVVRGVGKVSLDVYNFLLKINGKYDLTGKAGAAAADAIAKIKEQDKEGTVVKIEEALKKATDTAAELNKQYDLVDKSKQVVGYAGDLSAKAIDKSIELNKEYKITDKVVDTVKTAVEKGKAAKA